MLTWKLGKGKLGIKNSHSTVRTTIHRDLGIPKLGLEMLFISQAEAYFSQFKIRGSRKSEFVCREMENRGQSFSELNCIDLSCPDIHKSVSLLKQVRFVSKLLRLVAEKGERRKGREKEKKTF